MDLPKDMVAAASTPLVLAVLSRGDSYGYEILRSIRNVSGGQLEWQEGMLYPLLHRLAGQGLIESYEVTTEGGRSRKYYRLLPAGSRQLETRRGHFAFINSILDSLGSTRAGGVNVATR